MDFTNWTAEQYAAALMRAAIEWEIRAQRGNDFARGKDPVCRDIAAKLRLHGRFASERQKRYAEQLITWVQPRPLGNMTDPAGQDSHEQQHARTGIRVSERALMRIHTLFRAAREHNIRRPKISLLINGTRIKLAPARDSSRHPGSIYVTGQNDAYLGRIDTEGRLRQTRVCTDEHLRAIEAFGDNPMAIARAHGLRTGNCCFCRRELTDGRSTAMGYGPICAEHYGLEWGNQRARSTVDIERDGIAVGPLSATAQVRAQNEAEATASAGGFFAPSRIAIRDARRLQRGSYLSGEPNAPRRPQPVDATQQGMNYVDEDELFK